MRSDRILPSDWDQLVASEFPAKRPLEGRTNATGPETPQVIGVRHVGLSARDPAALAEFYRDVLGLQIVPAGSRQHRW